MKKLLKSNWFAVGLVVIIYFVISFYKIYLTKKIPTYDPQNNIAFYSTESAFHYRYAEKIATGEGIPEIDYRAQWPEGLNVYDNLTIGMEFVSGYLYRFYLLFNNTITFHNFLIYFICFFSSLSIFALYLNSSYICNNKYAGILSVCVYVVTPASFIRTTGNFIREDFTLPFIFFSLFFFLKMIREKKILYSILSSIFLLIGLLTWHFTQFYLIAFAITVIFSYFISLYDEITTKNIVIFILIIFVASLIFPILRHKMFYFSIPMLLLYSLIAINILNKKYNFKGVKIILLFICLFSIIFIIVSFIFKGYSAYSHVILLPYYKLIYLFKKPDEPSLLPFDVRLFWGDSFDTPSLQDTFLFFSIFLLLVIIPTISLIKIFLRKQQDIIKIFLLCITIFIIIYYIIAIRFSVFLVFFTSMILGLMTEHKLKKYLIPLLVCSIIFQVYDLKYWRKGEYNGLMSNLLLRLKVKYKEPIILFRSSWYDCISYIRKYIPEDSVILTNFGTGGTLYAYTNLKIVLNPEFESNEIRRKYEEFLKVIYEKSERDFFELCEKWKVDYFLYETRYVFEDSKKSQRYISNNLNINKNNLVYKFHFEPQKLRYFYLIYQNKSFRIFKIKNNKKADSLYFTNYYDIVYDKNVLTSNDILINDKVSQILTKLNNNNDYIVDGNIFNKRKMYDEAIINYQKAIGAYPYEEFPYIELGNIYYKNNKVNDALEITEKATQINPNNSNAYLNLIKLYYVTKQFKRIQDLENKIFLKFPKDIDSQTYSIFGMVNCESGFYSKAVKYLEMGLKDSSKFSKEDVLLLKEYLKYAYEHIK